jgi:ABC-type uncharacterized transport system permease subunit
MVYTLPCFVHLSLASSCTSFLRRYVEAVHMGLKGLVVNERGLPLANAGIVVVGINKVVVTTTRQEDRKQYI